MIDIDDLTVTQSGFRHPSQIQNMVELISVGGKFDLPTLEKYSSGKDIRLINISRFEDGRLFIHDGHHRVAAVYLGGRKYLYDDEYVIKDWTYSEYLEINFEKKWVTPFDPRTEVRVPDYGDYKKYVYTQLNLYGEQAAAVAIDLQHWRYALPRTVLTIVDTLRYI